jgi:lipopolysaccharide/colanic/teichoic acid biosynthesis glycosyltransferase
MDRRLQVSVLPDPILKRLFDVLLSVVALLITAPLWPFVALAAKLQGRGPILYRQQRWGRGGSVFVVRKFRTMTPTTGVVEQAQLGDLRVTRIGRVLRSGGLDELPQLLAILRGDMSFVGPRPLAVGEVVRGVEGEMISYEEVPGFEARLAVRPGLTGLSTIYLPKDAPPAEKFASDLRYIEERSFLGDMRLVVLSTWISLRGRWESRDPKL